MQHSISLKSLTQQKPDICATIIQNSTNHIATLATGHIVYIEVPNTNEKPNYYHQVNDINSSVHDHTYHPDISEPMPQTNYALQYTEGTRFFPTFSLHQVYMRDTVTKTTNSSLYNVQQTSQTTKPRDSFSSLS